MHFAQLLYFMSLFPLLLVKEGGQPALWGILLLGTEAILAMLIGRKIHRFYQKHGPLRKALPVLTLIAVYLLGNLLALWITLSFVPGI